MKKFVSFIIVLFALALTVESAQAQVALAEVGAHYDQIQSQRYWKNLEQQLTESVAEPRLPVAAVHVENIAFFARHFGDRLDLRPTVPYLLDLYQTHPDAGVRILAVQALRTLGDAETMATLHRLSRAEDTPLVKQVTRLALADYQRARGQ